MTRTGAYGEELAKALNVRSAATLVTRKTLNRTEIGATLLRADVADNTLTSPIVENDAFLMMLQLRDWPVRNLWADDKPLNAPGLATGATSIFDLSRSWVGHRVCPIHQLNIYLPRSALDTIADIEGRPRIDHFRNDPVAGVMDQVAYRLGLALLPAFDNIDEVNELFIDYTTTAIAAHLINRYGSENQAPPAAPRRLAQWQLNRVKELISANLAGNITMALLATECAMPLSEFSKAFALSVGKPPHLWLLERRVAKAMDLLRNTDMNVALIAAVCGFTTSEHLTRVFRRVTGSLPVDWRRAALH
jgi:AraC family transcriptional regulator